MLNISLYSVTLPLLLSLLPVNCFFAAFCRLLSLFAAFLPPFIAFCRFFAAFCRLFIAFCRFLAPIYRFLVPIYRFLPPIFLHLATIISVFHCVANCFIAGLHCGAIECRQQSLGNGILGKLFRSSQR
jgi:hypothetical protein